MQPDARHRHHFTIGHLFCGLGGGALGAARARVQIGEHSAEFRTLGGVDLDPASCEDFEALVDAPATVADVAAMDPRALRAAWGDVPPDMVLLSPPCKGFSALLSKKLCGQDKYQRMNRLLLDGLFLLCSTWDAPPPLIFVENVPRITYRGRELLHKTRQMLRAHGYVVTGDATHDCGELGGLAQHRRRFFMVARCPRRIPHLVYEPPKLRVRACGEVLQDLPIPGDEGGGGRLHRVPRISWLNWVRLALIPAGGDWRDLPGVVPDGSQRREVHRRHAVVDWDEPAPTVVGAGGAGAEHVADPRAKTWWQHVHGVSRWDAPGPTVTGSASIHTGSNSVADPRPANWVPYGVLDWDAPSGTVAAQSRPSNGRYSVADPRLGGKHYHAGVYGVLDWKTAAATVTGAMRFNNSCASVADPRVGQIDGLHFVPLPRDPRERPTFTPVIVAADGTWHRPFTTLELAGLQGFPTEVRGGPLALAGNSHTRWRERLGNAIPPPAAQAIASELLLALLAAKLNTFRLSSTPIWIAPNPWSAPAVEVA